MSNLLACRACLATDKRLYSIENYGLTDSFETLTNSKVSSMDGLPPYLCSYCVAALKKALSFLVKCSKVKEVFNWFLLQKTQPTQESISSIAREPLNLTYPYTISSLENTNYSQSDSKTFDKGVTERWLSTENVFLNGVTGQSGNPVSTLNGVSQTDETTQGDIELNIEVKFESDNSFDEPLSKVKRKVKRKTREKWSKVKEEVSEVDSQNDDFGDFGNTDEAPKAEHPKHTETLLGRIHVTYLTQEEQLCEVRARRDSDNFRRSAFRCQTCYKGFMSENTYSNHMKRHSPAAGPHACAVCGSRWARRAELAAHVANVHEARYTCSLCHYSTMFKHIAKQHLDWHNGKKYECKICGATFNKSTSHLSHMRLSHAGALSQFRCQRCGQVFLGEAGLHLHRRLARCVDRSQESSTRCSACEVVFKDVAALERHRQTDSCANEDLKACVSCGDSFTSEQLTAHVDTCDKRLACSEETPGI